MLPRQLSSSSSSSGQDEKSSLKISDKVVCEWEIEKFVHSNRNVQHYSGLVIHRTVQRNCTQEVNEVISPTFWHSESSEWCVELCRQNGVFYLCFHLLSSLRDPSEKAEVKASVKSYNGGMADVYTRETVSLNAPQTSTKKRIDFGQYVQQYTGYVLKLICEVSIPCETTESYRSSTLHEEPQSATDDLVANLGSLLDSGDLADFVLCAGGEELRAHRAVLSARSPVFAAMLRHDTREAQTGRIDIEDVDADTMRDVLRYIYTGRAPHMNKKTGKLLVAADKYDLQKLKELCEVELAKKLTVDNAAAAGVLALSHSCDYLKRSVVSFIKKNLVAVLGSDGWANATTNHTQIVVEMNRLIANKSVN